MRSCHLAGLRIRLSPDGVGYVRRNVLVPIPEVDSFAATGPHFRDHVAPDPDVKMGR